MTALKQYARLEATGLWRPTPEDQRREVVVSIGEATLTIADMRDSALTHWSLAAIERRNPGVYPAIYAPDGDPGETLELAETETAMIEAIEKLRVAVERTRPHPGRLRWLGFGLSAALVLGLLLFWLPNALIQHTTFVVPEIKRQEIGASVLSRIERVAGRACINDDATPVLARLASRTGADRLVVLPAGVQTALHLPGGIVLLNKALIEDYQDPAVAAGFVLAERAGAAQQDPLDLMLRATGPIAAFRLLTTGMVAPATIDRYAETVLIADRTQADSETLLQAFAAAQVPSTPYAFALDVTGETTLPLIEADPMAGMTQVPVLPDRDWVLLQSICGG